MRQRVKFLIGSLLATAGAFIALEPFLSVWQVAGQALETLPELPGVESSDTSHGIGAIYDPDFVLATRTYSESTPLSVQTALTASGFEAANINGSQWYVKECCGEYDAVWVQLIDTGRDGVVVASATAADTDVQVAAVFLVLFGVLLFVPGVVIALASFASQTEDRSNHEPKPKMDDAR